MTLNEAISKKIKRVHVNYWNEFAHVLLPDFNGPWAKLVDPCGFEPPDKKTPILMIKADFLSLDPNEDIWEEWTPPAVYVERFGPLPEYRDEVK